MIDQGGEREKHRDSLDRPTDMPVIEHEKWILSLGILAFCLIFLFPDALRFGDGWTPDLASLNMQPAQRWRENFTTYFVSIILEAAPYMIIGAFVAALIEAFVPQTLLPRMAKRLGIWGIPAIVLTAPLFTSCECGVVLVVRRLLAKGLPLPHAIAWMLAAPIVNPVVLTGTWLAFYQDPLYPLLRGLGGVLVAISVGFLVMGVLRRQAIVPAVERTLPSRGGLAAIPVTPAGTRPEMEDGSHVACDARGCGHDHGRAGEPLANRFRHALVHVRHDFLDMGTYFLFGVFLASLMKTFIDTRWLTWLGDGAVSGPAVMMLLSFTLSLCSEADAFVAASFVEFDRYAHTAFLVLGPMLDIKLLLMYRSLFQTRFILRLGLVIPLCVAVYVWLVRLVPIEWLDLFYDWVYGMGDMI